jgi:hypothetical protein
VGRVLFGASGSPAFGLPSPDFRLVILAGAGAVVFYLLAVIEVFLTLQWLLGDLSPTFGQGVAFETLNRVVTVVFKFVPFRIGVDEALSAAVALMLAPEFRPLSYGRLGACPGALWVLGSSPLTRARLAEQGPETQVPMSNRLWSERGERGAVTSPPSLRHHQ